jgi:hypothetical protein
MSAYSLEERIASCCREKPKTLTQISDDTKTTPSVCLATLRLMVANRTMLKLVNHDKTRAEFLTVLKQTQLKDTVALDPNPPKKTTKLAPSKKEARYDGQKDMCVLDMPNHGEQRKEEKSKKEEKPVVQADPATLAKEPPQKLDRHGSEFKAEKRKLIRPHALITEISAELKVNGTVSLYEILPDTSKPNGILVNQQFNIPVECINELCEALQSLRQLHKRYEG